MGAVAGSTEVGGGAMDLGAGLVSDVNPSAATVFAN